MAESYPNVVENTVGKHCTSNFSFSHSFQKACLPGRQKASLSGNGLSCEIQFFVSKWFEIVQAETFVLW